MHGNGAGTLSSVASTRAGANWVGCAASDDILFKIIIRGDEALRNPPLLVVAAIGIRYVFAVKF